MPTSGRSLPYGTHLTTKGASSRDISQKKNCATGATCLYITETPNYRREDQCLGRGCTVSAIPAMRRRVPPKIRRCFPRKYNPRKLGETWGPSRLHTHLSPPSPPPRHRRHLPRTWEAQKTSAKKALIRRIRLHGIRNGRIRDESSQSRPLQRGARLRQFDVPLAWISRGFGDLDCKRCVIRFPQTLAPRHGSVCRMGKQWVIILPQANRLHDDPVEANSRCSHTGRKLILDHRRLPEL